ncbi:MAG: hypothetical protein Q9164_005205 [Protoblastenia rupestris]
MEVPTKEKSQQKYRNEIALLEIARNIDLFAHWSIDYTNSVKILRQLSRCILRQDFDHFSLLSRRLCETYTQNKITPPTSNSEDCDVEYVAARLARLQSKLAEGDDGLLSHIKEVSSMLNSQDTLVTSLPDSTAGGQRLALRSPRQKAHTIQHIQEAISTLTAGRKDKLLDELLHDSTADRSDIGMLHVLRAIVLSTKNEEVEELRSSLSRSFTFLCQRPWQNSDFQESMLSMQSLSAILQRQPRVISQWHIDNLLATITVVSPQLQAKKTERFSTMLFTGLCRLYLIILRTHRAKIGGRYHLVVPALQSLLRCLFIPYGRSATDAEPTSAFTEQHAAEYSRILTALCDPTVSSVTRSKKRSYSELNDETKKARSIAGQHLPYLIMEYCCCHLKGRLTPEMRMSLIPGLWAVLEVMSKDAMKTMNAAMDSSSRSVFKALYDDFRRTGKWNGG